MRISDWSSDVCSSDLERLLLRLCDDLGYHLAQRFTWHNPARLPSPAEYVTIRRVRVNPATETIWWLSPSRNPKADNRRVLRPYSGRMKRLLEAGGETQSRRPRGHVPSKRSFGPANGREAVWERSVKY